MRLKAFGIRVVVGLLTLTALVIALLAGQSVFSKRPDNLGIRNGQLAPCPDSSNCVCTQADDAEHRMEPISFACDKAEILARIKRIINGLPRTKIVSESDNYLHVEFRSALFRFVDDVEFLIDDNAKLVHFRSASRVGYGDLGVNRKRMTSIREAMAAVQ